MTRDPVCGMKVDHTKATFMSTCNGQHFFFCNEACKKTFDANPIPYIKRKSAFIHFLDWIAKGNEETNHNDPPDCCGH